MPKSARFNARVLRKHYSELIVRPPFELSDVCADLSVGDSDVRCTRAELFAGWPGLADALAAARAGNVALVDEIELLWLNTWGPRLAVERFTDDERLAVLATEICRNAGPHGETLIEWALVRPCGRCWGRVKADRTCRFCSGRKHVSDEWEIVYTDYEGNQVEAR